MSEREKKSIIVQGVDTATPCVIAQDGTCEDIMNMRYKNGALQSLFKPKVIEPITDGVGPGGDIIDAPSFLAKGHYIYVTESVEMSPAGKPHYWFAYVKEVTIVDGVITDFKQICEINETYKTDRAQCVAFGNVLYVNYAASHDVTANRKEKTFLYKDGEYLAFDLDSITHPSFLVDESDNKDVPDNGERIVWQGGRRDYYGSLILKCHMMESGGKFYPRVEEYSYNAQINESLLKDGYIPYGFYIMMAYKMFDGSVIKPSRIGYISSSDECKQMKGVTEPPFDDGIGYARNRTMVKVHYQEASNSFEEFYYDIVSGVKPKLQITIPSSIDKNLIKSVVVYATRNTPEYDYERIRQVFENQEPNWSNRGDGTTVSTPLVSEWYRGRNKLLKDDVFRMKEQQFYEIAELPLPLSQTILTLDYNEHFKDIESKNTYQASYSNHSTISFNKFEYNSRLHTYDLRSKLFNGYDIIVPVSLNGAPNTGLLPGEIGEKMVFGSQQMWAMIIVTLNIDGKEYKVKKAVNATTIKQSSTTGVEGEMLPVYNLLNYPDARAEKIRIISLGGSHTHIDESYNLTKDLLHNSAYYFCDKNKIGCKVDPYFLIPVKSGDIAQETESPIVIAQKNKLQVSNINNPFVVSPNHIYSIGRINNIIEGLECAADQITETKFGLYPLFVFSAEGIFAMEAGNGEVVYQSIIAINNERKLQDTSTVSALNYVFYIGPRGVMSITGKNVELISWQLDTHPSISKFDNSLAPFETYIVKAILIYNARESEIIVYNKAYDYAYVFSVENKQWSRRNWNMTPLSTGLLLGSGGIYSAYQDDKLLPMGNCRIISRAIKLNSLEFKRVETIVARLQADNGAVYSIYLDGSNNLNQWSVLYKIDNSTIMRRTSCSFKYFRLRLEVSYCKHLEFTNFDLEYYLKFVHKLR